MAHIVGVGIAALDVINITDGYPAEDSKVRALAHHLRRGGNTANTLTVLSQLGHRCSWCGTIGDDAGSKVIIEDLSKFQIDLSFCVRIEGGHSPTSYITLNQQNGSRSIVHYRDLPEYAFTDFKQHDFHDVDWFHFEGRNIEETSRIIAYLSANNSNAYVSLEVEKPHAGIDNLFPLVKLLFFSRQYAISAGFQSPEDFLANMASKYKGLIMVCSWGEQGACAVGVDEQIHCSPALSVEKVVDTIGAGDTFHAGFIDAYITGYGIGKSLERACSIASKKCSQYGFDSISI